ncbi:pentatricopeptide repeat-containing protein At5g48910-like [Argentina anserina]|uniref:pentatricopeptide repeat-containing protein At5g48910-like n=1 Tax=Argentina anserina TaxID=57926 RepID=UPI0021767364|nr:pentatricopeptide repeat-containing protein At5g48910-like [Potentilla anserina]
MTTSFILVNQTLPLLEKCKTITELRQLHAHIIKSNLVNHTSTITKLISLCSHHGDPHHALSVFHRIPDPNPFIFFSLINQMSESSCPLEALLFYAQMLTSLQSLNRIEFLIPALLKACGKSRALEEGRQVHGQIVKTRMLFDPYVANALIRMYSELGCVGLAHRVFDTMHVRDQVSWNSLISGYLRAGEIELADGVFNEIPERDLVCCNAMIDGYMKSGQCELAEEVFRTLYDKDVVTWTSMISGYVVNDRQKEALGFFREMLRQGVRPDAPALVSVLSAIADLGFVEEGKWVHSYICMNEIGLSSGFIGSALVDMYAKCGHIENACRVFEDICHIRNIGDWNCMISGLAMHGLGHEALDIFLDMKIKDIEPDEITFLGLLTACNHGGLVDEGKYCFELMQEKYRLVPKIQHYGCIVDLLGRAGHLEEAVNVIQNMPIVADAIVWKAVLSACTIHGNVAIGEGAALRAIDLAPEDSSCYILLSNLYAKVGRWDDVGKVRLTMKQRGLRKVPGSSSVLVNGKVHEFFAGKEINVVYSVEVRTKIEEIVSRLKLEGYQPDLSQVLLDMEEESKEQSLILHSEKMALAFGLINRSKGSPIHIVKNLRICYDCHSFIKLVSGVYNCRIVVRDQNRFHQFESGSCSCKDFW